MSLYNNVADALASKGLVDGAMGGVTSALGGVADSAVKALGGGKLAQAAVSAVQSAGLQAAQRVVAKHIPASLQAKINSGSKVLGMAMEGRWEDAGLAAMESGVFDSLLSTVSGSARQQALMRANSPLVGGGSIKNATQILSDVMRGDHARKNLFILEVASLAHGDFSEAFNLFAVDVDYDPFNVAGDKQRVGGALVDRVTGQEAVEMQLTTYDNVPGVLKKWWARQHAATAARDGTVGVPANYAVYIKVIHGIAQGGNRVSTAYADEGLFRVSALRTSQSRREQAITELQMTLTQIDTFMKV